jgi:hypothetical protein
MSIKTVWFTVASVAVGMAMVTAIDSLWCAGLHRQRRREQPHQWPWKRPGERPENWHQLDSQLGGWVSFLDPLTNGPVNGLVGGVANGIVYGPVNHTANGTVYGPVCSPGNDPVNGVANGPVYRPGNGLGLGVGPVRGLTKGLHFLGHF